MDKNIQGHLFALTANILWGLMTSIGKPVLAEFSALSATTFRMVGTATRFQLLSLFCRREQVNHRGMLKIFFAMLFALMLSQGAHISDLSVTSPIDTPTVTTTLLIVTTIVTTIYLKESVTNKKVLSTFVGATGALILIMNNQNTGSDGGSVIGDLLCLITQISSFIYLTILKELFQKYPPITLSKWMFVYASMCYIPFPYHGIATVQWAEISTATLAQVGYVVMGGSFLAYVCITTAQRLLRPTVVSMYNCMQPIVASIVTVVIGMVTFNLEEGIAIALVFLGVYIITQSKSCKDLEKEGEEV